MTATANTTDAGTDDAIDFAAGAWSRGGHLNPPDTITDTAERNRWRMVEGATRWTMTMLDPHAPDRDPMTRQPTSDELVTVCARALVIFADRGGYVVDDAEQAIGIAEQIIDEAVRRLERDSMNGEPNGHDREAEQPAGRFKFITDDELEQQTLPEQLIEGLIARGSFVLLVGDPGSLKSFLALDWGYHVTRGKNWAGRKVQQGSVVYILAEGKGQFSLRTLAWKQVHEG